MPYGVDDRTWRLLPQEDRDVIKAVAEGRPVQRWEIASGQVVEVAAAPAQPPRATQMTPPPTEAMPGAWVWVRRGDAFPGNAPNMNDLKARGVVGVMIEENDPHASTIAANAHAAGLLVGIWSDPHGESPDQWANRVVGKAHALGAVVISPDVEASGKGYHGSPGWNYNDALAAEIRQADATIALVVTPLPLQDDFNYAAWVAVGAQIWPQSYGSTLDQVFDPVQVRDRVIANGVPPDRVSVILPAGSLATTVPQVQGLGLGAFGIYTIDDVSAGDRSIPFGTAVPLPAGQPFASPALPSSDFVPLPLLEDVPLDVLLPPGLEDADDIDGELESGEEPTIEDYLEEFAAWESRESSGQLRFLASAGRGPHLIGYPGTGSHSWSAPPNNWQSDNAVDVAMRPGTRIVAVERGRVSSSRGYGLLIGGTSSRFAGHRLHVEHPGGMISFYHHLRRLHAARGAFVERGAWLGDSGIAAGVAHLHFAVTQPFDPRRFWQRTFDADAPLGPIPGDVKPRPKITVKPVREPTLSEAWRDLQDSRYASPRSAQRSLAAARTLLRTRVR
jgi:hypothetical protein